MKMIFTGSTVMNTAKATRFMTDRIRWMRLQTAISDLMKTARLQYSTLRKNYTTKKNSTISAVISAQNRSTNENTDDRNRRNYLQR